VTGHLIGLTIEVSALALTALLVTAALRRASAALRHWVLSAAIVCAACLPAMQTVVPAWGSGLVPAPDLRTLTHLTSAVVQSGSPSPGVLGESRARVAVADAGGGPSSVPFAGLLPAVWLLGVAAGLGLIAAGLLRLAWLASRGERITDPVWIRLTRDLSVELGIRRDATLLQTARPSTLIAWGWLHPRILVSREAVAWSAGDVAIALRHELAHIARGDWVVQLLAEGLRAFNWFNPVVWLLPARLRAESECACDDVVLRGGVPGPEYAERLLSMARALGTARRWSVSCPAPSMARPSSLERRVAAMLSPRINRAPITARTRALVLCGALLVALPIAGLAVFAQSRAGFTGSVLDPAGRAVPDARIVFIAAETQAKHELRSDGTGRFAFTDLPTGRYSVEVLRPGFKTVKLEVVLAKEGGEGRFQLKLGSIRETIVVSVPSTPASGTAAPAVPASVTRATPGATAAEPCVDSGTTGGQIVPPKKLVDIKPLYPDHLRSDKVAGTVTLEGLVGRDGTPRDLRVIEAPHVDLGKAVVDAVGRWKFTPTLLNCEPVDVAITVVASFEYR
jgi:TonB family protein